MKDIRFYSETDFKIKNVGFINVVRKKDASFDCNKPKGKAKFVYIESGKMEYVFKPENTVIEILPGELLFVPGFLPYHAKYSAEGTTMKSITFDTEFGDTPSYIPTRPMKKVSKDIDAVFNAIDAKNMSNPLFLAAKIYELFCILLKNEQSLPKKYQKILPAIKQISTNYAENLKISHYAQLCNMSEPHFRKLFREYTGKSPIEYRNLIRIAEAKKLIESNEFTAYEAAYHVGFNNMSFFYELYKKELK